MTDLVLRSIAVAVAAATLTTPVAIAEELPASARVDCDNGDYDTGIATMEALLTGKRMGVPEPEQDG